VQPAALGVTGFCFGGGYTWELLTSSPDVKAAAPYYGTIRRMDQLAQTNAAVLGIYAANDTRITSQSTEAGERLRAAGKTVEIKVYPGVNHAFFNDTGNSYNADAARDAWATTIAWFRRYLTA
jgi:carboxymethylenebutenolidase